MTADETTWTPVNFGAPIGDVIAAMAEGDRDALRVLKHVKAVTDVTDGDTLPVLIDLEDMHMRGTQIAAAFDFWAGGDVSKFITACAQRDTSMVDFVNQQCTTRTARYHGPQHRLPQVDFAVQAAKDDAVKKAIIERIDDGAEYVHAFWVKMLQSMQANKSFTSNFRLNIDGSGTAVFAVTLVEILDAHGHPWKAQPQEEDKRLEAVIAERAANDTDGTGTPS